MTEIEIELSEAGEETRLATRPILPLRFVLEVAGDMNLEEGLVGPDLYKKVHAIAVARLELKFQELVRFLDECLEHSPNANFTAARRRREAARILMESGDWRELPGVINVGIESAHVQLGRYRRKSVEFLADLLAEAGDEDAFSTASEVLWKADAEEDVLIQHQVLGDGCGMLKERLQKREAEMREFKGPVPKSVKRLRRPRLSADAEDFTPQHSGPRRVKVDPGEIRVITPRRRNISVRRVGDRQHLREIVSGK